MESRLKTVKIRNQGKIWGYIYSEIVSRGANLQVSRGLIWGDFFKVASEP